MLPKGLKSGFQFLIIWITIADWQLCKAVPEPGPQPNFFTDLFGGGRKLEATGENVYREAGKKNWESVKDLVSRGADVNYGGGAVLWSAVSEGRIDLVKFLLEAGANPDGDEERHYKGMILQRAAEFNHLEIMDLLLAANASVITPKHGTDIMYRAAKNGHLEAVRKLIQAGGDPNFNDAFALLAAAEEGHADVVKELLEAGADVNAGTGWVVDNAAGAGHLEVMKILLAKGVAKKNLDSAMRAAASGGHFETVKLLFDNGADPNYVGTLRDAATNGNVDIVRLLLDGGANITYIQETGYPLQMAASKGHIDVVALLVNHGDEINRPITEEMWWDFVDGSSFSYGKGWTAMHVISRFGFPYVKELLDLGADINAKDVSGNTPLHVAVKFKKAKMAKEFLRFCIDASIVNEEGFTPLSLALNATDGDKNHTETHQKLMTAIQQAIPEKLASAFDNAPSLKSLRYAFAALANTTEVLIEQLKDIRYDGLDIEGALYFLFSEEGRKELPKIIEDTYCKPSMQKEHKVSIGTEYLAKCECVPGEGPTMTYTPVQEASKCQPQQEPAPGPVFTEAK